MNNIFVKKWFDLLKENKANIPDNLFSECLSISEKVEKSFDLASVCILLNTLLKYNNSIFLTMNSVKSNENKCIIKIAVPIGDTENKKYCIYEGDLRLDETPTIFKKSCAIENLENLSHHNNGNISIWLPFILNDNKMLIDVENLKKLNEKIHVLILTHIDSKKEKITKEKSNCFSNMWNLIEPDLLEIDDYKTFKINYLKDSLESLEHKKVKNNLKI